MIKSQRILVGAGVLLLLAAASLLGYSLVDDYLAGERAQKLLEETLLLSPALDPDFEGALPDAGVSGLSAAGEAGGENEDAAIPEVIGIVGVPRFNLKLPVFGEFTQEKLDISACRYSGKLGQPPERLVIAGHNYRSHFGHVPELEVGDEVLFTTFEGDINTYIVTELEAVTGYDRYGIATGVWDLTLLTCNKDLSMRVLVRCELAEEETV